MIRYHFDLYPRDDPRDGTRVVRFTKLQSAEYRGEANGTGSGHFSIRADTAEAQLIDPLGLQYVRVVREDTVAETEVVVGGFFLDGGTFKLLDTQGTRLLEIGGAGTLSYLSRSVMAPHTYLDIAIGTDPFDDTWRLYAQGPAAGGDMLGAVLWRAVYEAQHFRVALTEHRHADGVIYTDSHSDDRTETAIPDLVLDFDGFDDSNGNAWDQVSGEFKAQVNENLLAVVQRLMQAGLYVEMDPDTFELRAWQADDHRRDRTGSAWGSTVVRFQAPVAGDIDTGNIKSDALRKIAAFIKRSLLWVGGQDVYTKTTGTTDIPWEGGYYSDAADTSALSQIGSTQIGARDDAGDVLKIRGRLGTDRSDGYYRPFEDAKLDDLVTVHTGTEQFDHDEQDFPIAAITLLLRIGGDWDVWYELGSSYAASPSRQFQVTPVPAHNHPPNPELCRPGVIAEDELYEFWHWDDGDQEDAAHPGSITIGSNDSVWGDGATSTTGAEGTAFASPLNHDTGSKDIAITAGTSYRISGYFRRFNTNVRIEARWFNDSTTLLQTDIIVHNSFWPSGWNAWENTHTAPTGATNLQLRARTEATGGVGATGWVDQIRIYGVASGTSTVGDGHPDLVGTANRATRCDHRHDVHRDRPPAVTDDGSLGYKLGTIWAQLDDLDNPTAIVGVWMLVDTTTGAAVWLQLTSTPVEPSPPTVVDHGAMGADEDFDASISEDHEGTLDADLTVTLSGASDGEPAWLTLKFLGDGTNTITWPASVVWPGDVEPDPPGDGEVLIVSLFSYDGGTNWYGSYPGTPTSSSGGSGGLPLTAVVDGEPVLLWDENNSLIGDA